MMLSKSVLFLALFFALGALSGRQAHADTVCTANEMDRSLSFFSWPDKESAVTIAAGGMPHNVQAVPAKNLTLATTMEGKVIVFRNDRLEGQTRLINAGQHPAHVIADAEGKNIFVTLSGENAVAVIDLESGEISKKIGTGAFPHGLRMSPDGKEIYVANINDKNISVINVPKLEEEVRIPVDGKPIQVGFAPDGSRVFVSLNDTGAVAAIDVKTRQVLKVIKTGPHPAQVYAAGDLVYVANQGTAEEPGNTVTALDVETFAVKASIAVGRGPHGISAGKDGRNIFVTNLYDNSVSVIDSKNLAVVDTIPLGAAPNGITVE